MQALRFSENASQKQYLDSKCKDLVRKAEAIKGSKSALENGKSAESPRQQRRGKLKDPISNREIPKSEQILLWKGSDLNGFKFPPWGAPPTSSEFEQDEPFLYACTSRNSVVVEYYSDCCDRLSDHPELHLSSDQREIFDGWKRPHELFTKSVSDAGEGLILTTCEPSMKSSTNIDLVQDLTSDCSVVASLCATSSRAERGHSRVIVVSSYFLSSFILC